MSFRKYDPMVNKMIIESGNRNLFSDLNIRRLQLVTRLSPSLPIK
ncbi:hypothetical protein ACRXCV_05080 [Halobacteriovorax sp. GFR7]